MLYGDQHALLNARLGNFQMRATAAQHAAAAEALLEELTAHLRGHHGAIWHGAPLLDHLLDLHRDCHE